MKTIIVIIIITILIKLIQILKIIQSKIYENDNSNDNNE